MADNTYPEIDTSNTPPDHVGVLIASVVMVAVGWIGLYLLVTTQAPRIAGQLWLFFVLLHVAVTGTAIPIVRYVNVRFTPVTVPLLPGGIIVRQSVWVGLFVITGAWLQILRELSLPIAFLLGLIFIVIEVFLRYREISDER